MAASPSGFAHSIRTFRIRAGLSQEELAERAGVSARAISDMERGLRKSPRPETLRLLADALALDAAERAGFFAAAHSEPNDSARSRQRAERAKPEKFTTLPLTLRPLPVPPDELIGREHDVAAIVTLLESERVRLVTLTGPGGVGKTRLCLAVGARFESEFAEGVAFIDLAPLSEADHVAQAIAAALGLATDPQTPTRDALLAVLRQRELLLILDNFEHLLSAAPLLADILLESPLVKILVTSRVRLRLRAEHIYPVAPLPVPEMTEMGAERSVAKLLENPSVQLFLDRAGQATYAFDLDEQNADSIAEICRRLDGLPLAIELAASRMGLLPPSALLDRLPALSGGPRDAPVRQQTLRDTIAWSYDLLDLEDQTVFRRLSVFTGGFTLAAAEEVACHDGIAVTEAIELLAESSLLAPMNTFESEPRFTMLETVHSYAAELLERSGEAGAIRRRHAEWCIGLAETAGADLSYYRNVSRWYGRLNAELGNIRTAVEFLLRTGDGDGVVRMLSSPGSYWTDVPFLPEVCRWYRQAFALTGDSPDEATLYGHCQFAVETAMLGDLAQATNDATRILEWAVTTGSPFHLGAAYYVLGVLAEHSGDFERAISWHDRAAPLLREFGQPIWILNSTIERGSSQLNAGEIGSAVVLLEEGIALAREAGGDVELAYGLTYRAFAALAQDDTALAARMFEEGLVRAQALGMDRVTLSAIGGIAGVGLAIGQPERAARLLGAVEAASLSGGVGRLLEAPLTDAIGNRALAELGPERYSELLRKGARMPYAEALNMARQMAADAERRSAHPERKLES